MGRNDSLQVGTAGEHYVAFRLAQLGLVVALPRGGSPAVDILASNADGSKSLAIQVKTTENASRLRGRGENKTLHHLEFPLGHKAAQNASSHLVYTFVDLRGRTHTSVPVTYVVPSLDIKAYCGSWAQTAAMVRWHPSIESVNEYREAWDRIRMLLT